MGAGINNCRSGIIVTIALHGEGRGGGTVRIQGFTVELYFLFNLVVFFGCFSLHFVRVLRLYFLLILFVFSLCFVYFLFILFIFSLYFVCIFSPFCLFSLHFVCIFRLYFSSFCSYIAVVFSLYFSCILRLYFLCFVCVVSCRYGIDLTFTFSFIIFG